MASTKSVSSGTVFKALIELGQQKASTQGTKLNATEVKAALDVFGWNDGKVTKTEVLAAKKEFSELQKSKALSSDGEKAFGDWFNNTGTGAPGGFQYERSAEVFDNLEGWFRGSPDSQKGATFTKAEAQTLVGFLGDAPSPARVADVTELLGGVKAGAAHDVLRDWLKAHPMPAPAEPLNTTLAKAVKGLEWPSETDRPLYPVDLGKAPGPTASIENAARKALGEPDSAHIEVRDFDGEIDAMVANADPNDPASQARAAKFDQLRKTLDANLTNVKLIRVGDIDIDVYAVGKDKNGKWVGVMSGVVET